MTTRTVQLDTYTDVSCRMSITNCPVCGVMHGIPKTMEDGLRRNAGSYYCPNGHYIGWNETEAERQRKRAEKAEKDRDYWQNEERKERERAERFKREKAAVKGQLTKTKKRIGNGVCPCCNRSFSNLRDHMSTEHPDYLEPTETA